MAVVSANHPDLISNIVFVKLMELHYRQLHMQSMQVKKKNNNLLKKLIKGYKKRY